MLLPQPMSSLSTHHCSFLALWDNKKLAGLPVEQMIPSLSEKFAQKSSPLASLKCLSISRVLWRTLRPPPPWEVFLGVPQNSWGHHVLMSSFAAVLGLSPRRKLLLVTEAPAGFSDPGSTLSWIRRLKLKLSPERSGSNIITSPYPLLLGPGSTLPIRELLLLYRFILQTLSHSPFLFLLMGSFWHQITD